MFLMKFKRQCYFLGKAVVLPLLFSSAISNAQNETNGETEQRLKALENEVSYLRQHHSKTASMNMLDRFSVNGYLNLVLSQSNRDIAYWNGEKDSLSFTNHSSGGIRFNAKMAEQTHAVMQFEIDTDTNGNYETGIEWFYLQHYFTDTLSIKAGRMSAPVLDYSEEFNVGFAYPWVRPPEEVYGPLPLTEIDGINLAYDNYFGEFGLRIKGTWGYNDFSYDIANVKQDNIFGLDGELSYKAFSVRASQLQMKFKADLRATGDRIIDTAYTLTSAGFSFDNNQVFLIGEYADYKLEEPTPTFADEKGYYLTAGWYIGKFTPFYTYAVTKGEDSFTIGLNGQPPATLKGREQRGQYLGLRYNINEQSALTLQVQYLDKFNGSNGLFGGQGGVLFNGNSVDFDSATIAHLAYQAVF
jgi:hypothetical protein